MEKLANKKQYDLEDRTLLFARRVRDFVRQLPKNVAIFEDGKQVIRSSGSIGANYIEANESLSKKDFLMRIKIARKEAKETRYWLELLEVSNNDTLSKTREQLIKEARELMMILSAVLRKSDPSLWFIIFYLEIVWCFVFVISCLFNFMEYLIHLLILIGIYAILGLSLDLVVGYTGLLSVTHAAFYGLGAYATAILLTTTGMNFFLSLLLGMIITAVLALAIGAVLSRFRDDYYALGSFGFNIIIWSIFLNWQEVTRGPLGIPGIKRPELFGFSFTDNISFLILVFVICLLVFGISTYISRSAFGRVLKAIREDEEAIRVFGYATTYYKLAIFVIGAALAAMAGSLFAAYITFIDPSTFTLMESIFLLAIIILGGLANNKGAVLGAIFLILLPEALRFVGFPSDIAAQMRQVVYGLLLIILMLYRPQGLIGKYKF